MTAVFYDLETSDTHPIGQILNYSFIRIDKKFQPVSELNGTIKLSRLELPRAGALLANRIDILKHQQDSKQTEAQAMRSICEYLQNVIDDVGARVPLIGYNSSRFDLPYLRTSLMRNGVNPYFFGKLSYKDLLFSARKLASQHPKFPRIAALDESGEKTDRLSLRLESLTKHFKLLKGAQTHFSRDDVLLTIDLAKYLYEEFGLDVRTHEAYEAGKFHAQAEKHPIIWAIQPNYDLKEETHSLSSPYAILDANSSSALWIDLDRYKEQPDESAIVWRNVNSHQFILDTQSRKIDSQTEELAHKAVNKLSSKNLDNFFSTSTCDIEFDIYRLHKNFDFRPLEALASAIWNNDPSGLEKLSSRDAKILFMRFQLANYEWGGKQDPSFEKTLKKYYLYRYSGELPTVKNPEDYDTSNKPLPCYPGLQQRYDELLQELANASDTEDRVILNSLKTYYDSSDVLRLVGEGLLKPPPSLQPPKHVE